MKPRKKARPIVVVLLLGVLNIAATQAPEPLGRSYEPEGTVIHAADTKSTWYPPVYSTQAHKKHPDGRADLQTSATSDFDLLVKGIRFFQQYISPVDSPRCPMYPTCSTYALQALERHGPVVGTFLTVDRLLHETSKQEQTRPMQGFERIRYYDPLENNDFWLRDKSAQRKD